MACGRTLLLLSRLTALASFTIPTGPDAGKETISIQDFQAGHVAMLASHDISARHPVVISQDGSRVAYSTDAGDYIIDASGGAPDNVCGEECAFFGTGRGTNPSCF